MLARMATAHIQPGMLDEAIQAYESALRALVGAVPGFKRDLLLVDRRANQLVSIGIWSSVAEMRQDANDFQQRANAFSRFLDGTPTVQVFELALDMEDERSG